MEAIDRRYRVEVHGPAGGWVFGSWVAAAGTGLLTDRLERDALRLLGSEPAGSTARIYRYVAHSIEPTRKIGTVTVPVRRA